MARNGEIVKLARDTADLLESDPESTMNILAEAMSGLSVLEAVTFGLHLAPLVEEGVLTFLNDWVLYDDAYSAQKRRTGTRLVMPVTGGK